jgi:hypothetical protein
LLIGVAAAALAAGLIGPMAAGAASGHGGLPFGPTGLKGLPQRNPNPHAAPARQTASAPEAPLTGSGPTIGASWAGISDNSVSPPDTNGAIGPNSYVEIINLQIAIYQRTGTLIQSASLQTLTGHSQFSLSDPVVLWDPDTQRFYYNVWDVGQSTMAWGFSKNDHPTTIPGSFCNYTNSFGYTTSEFPDYPKFGQSKDFLLIGVNHYPSLSSMHADRSDVLWINKPQGSGPVTTCPAGSNFKSGKFTDIRNQDGTQAWTPVPAMQDDPSGTGFVVSSSDIECPDICGTGTKITVHAVRDNPNNPGTPQMLVTGKSITVPSFAPPSANAPQKGTTNLIHSQDGRLMHAISAFDPSIGRMVVWTGHSVLSTGGRTEFRWYEISVKRPTHPVLVGSGVVKDSSLWIVNGGVAPDRTVTPSGAAHGDSIVITFTTTSSTTFPADQMVSKIGSGAQSAFVMVHQSTTFDSDFTCHLAPFFACRWGDYPGARSDPSPSLLTSTHGEVWITQEQVLADGTNGTWNHEAKP